MILDNLHVFLKEYLMFLAEKLELIINLTTPINVDERIKGMLYIYLNLQMLCIICLKFLKRAKHISYILQKTSILLKTGKLGSLNNKMIQEHKICRQLIQVLIRASYLSLNLI